jgi:DNA-binding NtrC family response regulator
MQSKVLLIEDTLEDRRGVIEALRREGCQVETISGGKQAFATVADWAARFDAVIIEKGIQGGRGLELLHAARSKRRELPIVIVGRAGDWESF